ncbi:LamG-like jellyroll fold domain-containing protein [Haloferula sp.]|uniref:LamG-like jellyroll fold domain-containing protein n=1 Tax=Haloferula sp. TaxID=2497595 RepID=UPI003C7635D1
MKGSDGSHEVIDVANIWGKLAQLEDGTLDPESRDKLMALLDVSKSARKLYLEYFDHSVGLEAEAKFLDEHGKMPVIADSLRPWRVFRRSIITAAALVVLSATVGTLFMIRQPELSKLTTRVAAGTRWMVDGEVQLSGSEEVVVVEGSKVRVTSGTVRLQLESGTVMVMQGPAEISFAELDRPFLQEGWLWVDSGESDEAFEVGTPELLIRDIGTRFGVRVPAHEPVEVHLVDGLIDIIDKESGGMLTSLIPAAEGLAIPIDEEPYQVPLGRDPFPELAALLSEESNYRTTVLSQTPVGYWRFEEKDHGELVNELPDGSTGGYGLSVVTGVDGLGSAGGFLGFGDDSKAVKLIGEDPLRSVLVGLDSSQGISRQEGAIGFWIRRHPGAMADEVLWLAGVKGSGGSIPEASMLHTLLTSEGRVEFFIENGAYDVQLSSTRSIADGRWHQIVASWGPTSVDLYVDGKRVARDGDSRTLKEGITAGRYVRFGKPSYDLQQQGYQSFSGWVDELALWSRPLTHGEVSHQYRSALGETPD